MPPGEERIIESADKPVGANPVVTLPPGNNNFQADREAGPSISQQGKLGVGLFAAILPVDSALIWLNSKNRTQKNLSLHTTAISGAQRPENKHKNFSFKNKSIGMVKRGDLSSRIRSPSI
ncbi:unnamed protein product [Lepeophtheirus salmonis]|uniref:(salmon louse) hypothetical protein n=1 Tax=Lepeophtheirus salmonis TaxID=72036 RepID=A0A7R8H4C2_LEPSM|nr:unnamed protein product [Lepeophtheirus salmonis]CAF2855069.1 unnamed protein product [Lepeophtheirus salmonis]